MSRDIQDVLDDYIPGTYLPDFEREVNNLIIEARLDEFKRTIEAMNSKTELHPLSNETRLKWRTRQRELFKELKESS